MTLINTVQGGEGTRFNNCHYIVPTLFFNDYRYKTGKYLATKILGIIDDRWIRTMEIETWGKRQNMLKISGKI